MLAPGGEESRTDNVFGMRIRELRRKARLSQAQLADVLNVSCSTVSQYESGQRSPYDSIKIRIADYFGVSLDYLFGREADDSFPEKKDGLCAIEIDVRKRSIARQELEDLRHALSDVDDTTLRAIIQLLRNRC